MNGVYFNLSLGSCKMEKYLEIERSIIKTYRKVIWSKFIKAVND